jgi:prepilin-type N-terminal cleavage/methylation domain-containing protein
MSCTDNRGVTLIELLVVIAIISVLVLALGFSYQGWMGAYKVERSTRELYGDLIATRARAMQFNRTHFVVIGTNSYRIYDDLNENGSWTSSENTGPIRTLEYRPSWTSVVVMNNRGLIDPAARISWNNLGNIKSDYDCILITQTNVNLGWMTGATCLAK